MPEKNRNAVAAPAVEPADAPVAEDVAPAVPAVHAAPAVHDPSEAPTAKKGDKCLRRETESTRCGGEREA